MAKHGKKTAANQQRRGTSSRDSSSSTATVVAGGAGTDAAPVRPAVKRKWLLATLAVVYVAWLGLLVTLSLIG